MQWAMGTEHGTIYGPLPDITTTVVSATAICTFSVARNSVQISTFGVTRFPGISKLESPPTTFLLGIFALAIIAGCDSPKSTAGWTTTTCWKAKSNPQRIAKEEEAVWIQNNGRN